MNIWEAFDELNNLEEAYKFNGSYKSPYLNISEADKQAAQEQWALYSTYRLVPTADGWTTPGLLDRYFTNVFKYVLDYDVFHKAYDADLNQYGLLPMFNTDGTLGPRGCYGNIKESNLSNKDPLYREILNLWAWVHSDDKSAKRANTIDKATADKLVAEKKEEHAKWEAEQKIKAEKEAKEKAELKAAEEARDQLVDILPDALALVDQDLLDQLEETGSTGVDIGHKGTVNYLIINKFDNTSIPAKPIEDYTPEFLADYITDCLNKLDLATQVQMHYLGLDIVKEFDKKHPGIIDAYWLDTKTNEIYIPSSKYTQLINRKTKSVATPEELENCTLSLIKVSYQGSKQTARATEDVHSSFYYSYNEDLTLNSALRNLLPHERSAPLVAHRLTYYDNGYEEVSNCSSFFNFPGFDVWLLENETIYGNG